MPTCAWNPLPGSTACGHSSMIACAERTCGPPSRVRSRDTIATPEGRMADNVPDFPPLEDLHVRPFGLTEALARCYAEGAAICMQTHHTSPKTVSVSADDDLREDYIARWRVPSVRQLAAWNNRSDAIRDAAYPVAIAAAEVYLGLFVVARAPQGSGADYLVSPQRYNPASVDALDLEDPSLIRLEVKGRSRCDGDAQLDALAREAAEQLRHGNSDLPGLGGAVAFDLAQIRFRRI